MTKEELAPAQRLAEKKEMEVAKIQGSLIKDEEEGVIFVKGRKGEEMIVPGKSIETTEALAPTEHIDLKPQAPIRPKVNVALDAIDEELFKNFELYKRESLQKDLREMAKTTLKGHATLKRYLEGLE